MTGQLQQGAQAVGRGAGRLLADGLGAGQQQPGERVGPRRPARRQPRPAHDQFLQGETNLLAVEDLSHNLDRLRELFELLEQKSAILRILELALQSEGVKVFIGGEAGVGAPEEVSVVTSAYSINGEIVGAVGVIGPTRMAYDRIVPIVDVTAKLLSSALSQP